MPTYEYQCDACSYNFDEFQSFSDPPLKTCPQCRRPKLRRVFGPGAGIIFKGSGFYQTDYRSESYKAAAKADQEAARSAEAGKNGTSNGESKNGSSKTSGKTAKSAT
ncbi:MAG TPA: zinc ribbon domain-containing protein [Gemmataceae bacterium]|nr:zinc ribbon domain-containing protein [Gemmataceae bacterium]